MVGDHRGEGRVARGWSGRRLHQNRMNVSISMIYHVLSPLVSSEGARGQRFYPHNPTCRFRIFVEVYRHLDKGVGWGGQLLPRSPPKKLFLSGWGQTM